MKKAVPRSCAGRPDLALTKASRENSADDGLDPDLGSLRPGGDEGSV